MASIASKIKISSKLVFHSKPSIAFFESLMSIESIGSMIGKLKTAIKVEVFSAFEAIPATIVKVEEKPIAPSTTAVRYINKFCTGFPKKII